MDALDFNISDEDLAWAPFDTQGRRDARQRLANHDRAKIMTQTLVDIIGPFLSDAQGNAIPWKRIREYVESELSDAADETRKRYENPPCA